MFNSTLKQLNWINNFRFWFKSNIPKYDIDIDSPFLCEIHPENKDILFQLILDDINFEEDILTLFQIQIDYFKLLSESLKNSSIIIVLKMKQN